MEYLKNVVVKYSSSHARALGDLDFEFEDDDEELLGDDHEGDFYDNSDNKF